MFYSLCFIRSRFQALPLLDSAVRNLGAEIARRREKLAERLMRTGEGAQIVAVSLFHQYSFMISHYLESPLTSNVLTL